MDQHPALDTTGTAIVEINDWQPAMSFNFWHACMNGYFTVDQKITIPDIYGSWFNE